jgi:hypothetical protein
VPIAVSTVERDNPMQKTNGDDMIMARGSLTQQNLILMEIGCLTEICKNSSNSNEDSDDNEFPPVHKIRPSVYLSQAGGSTQSPAPSFALTAIHTGVPLICIM